MTNEEIVSRIRSTHKLLSGDNSINDRVILAEARGKAVSLIRQEVNTRKLWNTDTLFTTIPCLEMVEVPLGECCSYTGSKTVSRSKHKLPSISDGYFGYLIKGVYAIDLSRDITYLSVGKYINLQKIKRVVDKGYYWIQNNYVYCSLPEVKLLTISCYLEDDLTEEILYPDCECKSEKEKDCPDPMHEEFKCPQYLIDGKSGNNGVIALVSATLLSTYFNIPLDRTSDGKDDQSK